MGSSKDFWPRSWLFVPAHQGRMMQKSSSLATDVVIYDLEDGVPSDQKNTARELVVECAKVGRGNSLQLRYVRINGEASGEYLEADLNAAVRKGIDGLLLPKVENTGFIIKVEKMVKTIEKTRALAGETKFLIAIESPLAILRLPDIAFSSKRILGLNLGAEDFAFSLGLPLQRTKEARELLYIRSQMSIVASAAGIQAIDAVWTDLGDPDGLLSESEQARRLGFTGKTAIHPSQIEIINRAFTPTKDELAYAYAVLEASSVGASKGNAAINFQSQMVDAPVVARAQRIVDQMAAFNSKP